MEKEPITSIGFIDLKKKLRLFTYMLRPKILDSIKKAREFGDLRENAEYHAAREELLLLDKKIKEFEKQILVSDIINTKKLKDKSVVRFGSIVTIQNLENLQLLSYQIVGEYESDLNQNKISVRSPLAKAMILKKKNDVVFVEITDNFVKYKIIDISI
ncbi:MAG TPA: transcription elongation factor GreA [Candidatus Azoamicus sp. OHIO2]